RGLAGAPVADDQLALTAPDRDHGVDRLEACLQGLLHRAAIDDPRRVALDRSELRGGDRPLAVHGLTERVHDATDQRFADRPLRDAVGALDVLAGLHTPCSCRDCFRAIRPSRPASTSRLPTSATKPPSNSQSATSSRMTCLPPST